VKETESPTETIGCVSGFHHQRQFIQITKEHWFSFTDSKHIVIWSPSAVLEPTSKTKCRTAALVLYIYNLSIQSCYLIFLLYNWLSNSDSDVLDGYDVNGVAMCDISGAKFKK